MALKRLFSNLIGSMHFRHVLILLGYIGLTATKMSTTDQSNRRSEEGSMWVLHLASDVPVERPVLFIEVDYV